MRVRQWFRVRAEVSVDDAPGLGIDHEVAVALVADALWTHSPPAVEQQDGPTATVLLAGYAEEVTAEAAAAAATSAGAARTVVEPIEDDGLDAWRAHARAHRAGRFTIIAPWLTAEAETGTVPLLVDPGTSFGSGSHPTTRLVLEALSASIGTGMTVLDVGCGSGILSVAAALLGARHVTAIDVDVEAAPTTTANALLNGVADRVTATDTPLGTIAASGRRFDVVTANLLAPILVELADDLRRVTGPGGRLIVSGLLADRWEPTVDRLRENGHLRMIGLRGEGDWVAVELEASAANA